MNLDIHEEKVRISIEVREFQSRLQQNKEEERQIIEELLKRKGKLEFLEELEQTTQENEDEQNEQTSDN